MNRIVVGLAAGLLAGALDVAPMLAQKLPWEACASAGVMWVVIGFLTGTVELDLRPIRKGILIAFLVLAPAGILIGAKEPLSLLPIAAMTLILGGGVGYAVGKFGQRRADPGPIEAATRTP